MSNEEIKIFANMALILPKIENKNAYFEEDYFNIYQLIFGYKELEKYFKNKDTINDILQKKINEKTIYDLIRLVRNRYSHIEKINEVDKYILLHTKVDKNEINKLINAIKNEMDIIFYDYLNGDIYKLIMNTKPIIYMFELMCYVVNNSESKNEFDDYSKNLLKPIINNFKYAESTFEDYHKVLSEIIELFKSKKIKDEIIMLYGTEIYNELLKLLIDDTYEDTEIINLLNKIKNTTQN